MTLELSLSILNKNNETLALAKDYNEVNLVYNKEYEEGDKIVITVSKTKVHLHIQVDDALGDAFVYVTQNEIVYEIPFGNKRLSMSPKVFSGCMHLLYVREAEEKELGNYRNLSLNVMDQYAETGCYPHASANATTRGESVFAAKNAIDGVRANHSHGSWPYESWGINMKDDASMKLEFGRKVIVEKIVLYTRSDFPHDNWWEKVTLTFSNGERIEWTLEKSDKAHVLNFGEKQLEWLTFSELIKADDPSPFPALTQIEVYGRDIY
ncbi:MAG: hypothetical protein K0S61_601 [Anaerocolumna sp.]|jgi:hypothetical protein|nr:hypothetical protein [Anaerocolumna sp.]